MNNSDDLDKLMPIQGFPTQKPMSDVTCSDPADNAPC